MGMAIADLLKQVTDQIADLSMCSTLPYHQQPLPMSIVSDPICPDKRMAITMQDNRNGESSNCPAVIASDRMVIDSIQAMQLLEGPGQCAACHVWRSAAQAPAALGGVGLVRLRRLLGWQPEQACCVACLQHTPYSPPEHITAVAGQGFTRGRREQEAVLQLQRHKASRRSSYLA